MFHAQQVGGEDVETAGNLFQKIADVGERNLIGLGEADAEGAF